MAFIGSAPGGSRATDLGQTLGSGLGKGLAALAEVKLGQLQQAQDKKFWESQGYTPQEASVLSYYRKNPKEQQQFLQGLPPEIQAQMGSQQGNQQQQFGIPQQQNQTQFSPQEFIDSLRNPTNFAQARMGNAPQLPPQQQPISQGPFANPQQGQTIKRPSFGKPLTAAEKLNQEKHQEGLAKEKNDLLNSYDKAAQTADSVVAKVDAIEKLSQRDDFKTGYDYWLNKNYGRLPRSNQLADKLIAELTPGIAAANSASGSRITDALRETVANSIPNPYEMTREGMKDASEAIKNIYKIPSTYSKTAKSVFAKNPNASSSDLQRLVNEQSKPEIDKLYDSIIPEELKLGQSSDQTGFPGGSLVNSAGRGVARAAESFVGAPGDIVDLVSSLVGKVSPEAAKVLQQIPLPNSEQVREAGKTTVGQAAPGLYNESQGTADQAADKFGALLGSVLFPLGGPAKSLVVAGVKPTLIKGLKLAGAGTLAGYLGKAVGGEKGEKAATIGTILLANVGGPRAIREYAKTLPNKQANEVFKAMSEPSKIHEFMRSHIPKGYIKSDATKALIGYGAIKAIGAANVGKGILAGVGAGYAEKALRALKNPDVQKYFYHAVTAAAKENPVALLTLTKKLDDTIRKHKLD